MNHQERTRMDWLELQEKWLQMWLDRVREELYEVRKHHHHHRRLQRIEIRFNVTNTTPQSTQENNMAPETGPLTLTVAGQTAVASVRGFDQNNQPMPADFTMPPASFSIDNAAVATVNGSGTVTAVADGTAILSAKVTSAEGAELSASADVTVEIAPPPETPVLTTIQIAFDTAPPAAAAASNLTPNQRLAAR